MTKTRKATAKAKSNSTPAKRTRAARLPRKDRCGKTVQRLTWQGITVLVSYEPDWHGMSDSAPEIRYAHLEVRKLSPAWALLPITETGYRSHFLASDAVESTGGPVAYVRAWLDEAAKSPGWKRREFQSRQLSLF